MNGGTGESKSYGADRPNSAPRVRAYPRDFKTFWISQTTNSRFQGSQYSTQNGPTRTSLIPLIVFKPSEGTALKSRESDPVGARAFERQAVL